MVLVYQDGMYITDILLLQWILLLEACAVVCIQTQEHPPNMHSMLPAHPHIVRIKQHMHSRQTVSVQNISSKGEEKYIRL
jgi:hypothetical protein